MDRTTPELLQAWREAERRWESIERSDPAATAAGREVVVRWLAYQEATPEQPEEFILVANSRGSYVAASANVVELLGYSLAELMTHSVADLTHPRLLEDQQLLWQAFIRDGQQEGAYRLRRRDGTDLLVTYRARAHHPIPGYYVSRLRPHDGRTALDGSGPN